MHPAPTNWTKMISASKLKRVLSCPGSLRLPQIESESEAAQRGHAIHTFLEKCATLGRDVAIAQCEPEYLEDCKAIDLDHFGHDFTNVAVEVSFGYNIETGEARELDRGRSRSYSKANENEIVGCADVVAIHGDDVFVCDYKTGRSLGDPASNEQLLFLALCASKAYGKRSAIVELAYVWDGEVYTKRSRVDGFRLVAFAEKLRGLKPLIEGDPVFKEGDWCKYCPGYSECPAKKNLALVLGRGEWDVKGGLTSARIAEIWPKLKLAKDLIGRIEKTAYAIIERDGPVSLADGTSLEMVVTSGPERIDGKVAYSVVSEVAGEDKAKEAVQYSCTKKSLRAALGKGDKEVLAELRRRGALTKRRIKRLRVFDGD